MGKESNKLHVLLTALSLSVVAQASDGLRIRGAVLPLPLDIRILIREASNEEVKISGYELHEPGGRSIPGDSIKCRYRSYKTAFNTPLLGISSLLKNRNQQWVCEAGALTEALTRPLRLTAKVGFMTYNDFSFRDVLELVPRENGKLAVVNALNLEDYLVGVVNKEIRSDFPREAIKAQIVAARSYALSTLADRRKNRVSLWDLQSNEMDQVYEGAHVEDARSHRFVKETLGQVLMHSGQVLRAFYHSSNGGFSEDPMNVWGDESGLMDAAAYAARVSPIDRELSPNVWKIHLSPQLGEVLFGIGRIKDVRIMGRTTGQRVKSLVLVGEEGSKQFTGAEFRRKLGNRWLKSTLFWVAKKGNAFMIEGRGFGHGVGMSQLGARSMARVGKSYKEILKFYYPRAQLNTLALVKKIEKEALAPLEQESIVPLVR